jgi:titin
VTPVTVAGAPTITSVTAGDASASVAWTAPAGTGGSPVTGYVVSVYQGTGKAAVRTVEAAATATSAQLSGLVNGTAYTVTVAARNAAGLGTASAGSVVTPQPPVTVPGAPTIKSVTAGDASASVAWTAPAGTGGSPVTGYVVSVYEGTGTAVVRTLEAATTATTVSGLRNGTSYSFSVSARNAAGQGAVSGRSGTVTPSTVPGVPTIGEATSGSASASVGWTMSTDTGGTALTGYVVKAYPGTATKPAVTLQVPASATRATVSGLVNGTGYTFTVAAVNANGVGAESARSARVVPAAAAATPGAPGIGTATPGNGTATVNWSAPSEPGTSPVLGYAISASGPAGTPSVRTVLAGWWATSATVPGLTNGVAYTFTVTALNMSGTGARSAPSNAVTPQAPVALPGAPRTGAATAGDGSVSITWTAPRQTGGAPITGYLVSVSAGNRVVQQGTADADDTGATVSGLMNGVSYTVRVSAASAAGIGAASDRSNAVTPSGRPDAPTSVRATAGDRKATVRWTEPADDGGSAITGYVVSVFTGTGTEPTRTVKASRSATSVTVPDLTNGKAYTFTVAAVNGAGTGDDSARSETITPKK